MAMAAQDTNLLTGFDQLIEKIEAIEIPEDHVIARALKAVALQLARRGRDVLTPHVEGEDDAEVAETESGAALKRVLSDAASTYKVAYSALQLHLAENEELGLEAPSDAELRAYLSGVQPGRFNRLSDRDAARHLRRAIAFAPSYLPEGARREALIARLTERVDALESALTAHEQHVSTLSLSRSALDVARESARDDYIDLRDVLRVLLRRLGLDRRLSQLAPTLHDILRVGPASRAQPDATGDDTPVMLDPPSALDASLTPGAPASPTIPPEAS